MTQCSTHVFFQISCFLIFAIGAFALQTIIAAEKAAGWKLLFDGKTSTVGTSEEEPAGNAWTIDDGAIKTGSHPNIVEDLFSNDTFETSNSPGNGNLTGGNSGLNIAFRRIPLPKRRRASRLRSSSAHPQGPPTPRAQAHQEYVIGFEYQMIDDKATRRSSRSQVPIGSLYDMIPTNAATPSRSASTTNRALVVRGDSIEHYLNGTLVVKGTLADEAIKAGHQALGGRAQPVATTDQPPPKVDTHLTAEPW